MLMDALLQIKDDATLLATESKTLSSATSSDLPPSDSGVALGDHLELMFTCTEDITGCEEVIVEIESTETNFTDANAATIGSFSVVGEFLTADGPAKYMRLPRGFLTKTQVVITATGVTAGKYTLAIVDGPDHVANYPKGYSH